MLKAIEIRKNSKGKKFALCADVDYDRKPIGTYGVWVLCSNYDGKVRGGIRQTWRYAQKGLSLEAAKDLINRRAGR